MMTRLIPYLFFIFLIGQGIIYARTFKSEKDFSTPRPQMKKMRERPPIPPEIKHCLWNTGPEAKFSFEHPHLGKYNLCRSNINSNQVFFQLEKPETNSQICFIPTHHEGKLSTYVGEPRCLMIEDVQRIYRIDLYHNRRGLERYDIDGVMIIKDQMFSYGNPFNRTLLSTDSYLFCQHWLAQRNDPTYCQSFVQLGQFIDHIF
jgi:hypothetical protein